MRLLLDTHAFIWAASDPDRLSPQTRQAISDSEEDLFVSAAATWEMTIKHSLGKLELPLPLDRWIYAALHSLRADELAVTIADSLAVADLPAIHGDPFDRIMIAQCHRIGLTLITQDSRIRQYPGIAVIE